MWSRFLAQANTTWSSLSCPSTTRPATPSNYFNHVFTIPPACSTQTSWKSPGNYSKIRWEAELKHESSGGCKKGQATTRGSLPLACGVRPSPCPTFPRFVPLTHPAHMEWTCLDREGGNIVFFLYKKGILKVMLPHPVHWQQTRFVCWWEHKSKQWRERGGN